MKIRNYIPFIALLIGVSILPSCLKEEDDIFNKSGAERLNDAQKYYEEILTSASNGWLLEYIAGDTDATRRGAFNYLLKFEDGEVTAAIDALALSDIDPSSENPFETKKSLYRFDQDMGITLSFSSYNPFLHYYHEQHGSYTTYKGDFEFTIMEAYEDLVILRGKKYGNIMEMHRLPETLDWNDYLEEVNTIIDLCNIYTSFELRQDGQEIGTGTANANYRYSFKLSDEEEVASNAIYTTSGIKFIDPLTINGKEAQTFTWENETKQFVCTDDGVNITIVPVVAPEYIYYEQYIGDFTVQYNNTRSIDVAIEQKIKGRTLKLVGLIDFEIELIFDKMKGTVSILTQDVGTLENGTTVAFCPWDSEAGYYTWGVGIGTESVVNLNKLQNENILEFSMIDNGVWGSRVTRGYLLRLFDSVLGSHSSATGKGNYTANSTGHQFYNLVLTKKQAPN